MAEFKPLPRLVKTRQAAEMLGVQPRDVRLLVAAGWIPYVRLTQRGNLYFRERDIEMFRMYFNP